jgi:hypothetical protein
MTGTLLRSDIAARSAEREANRRRSGVRWKYGEGRTARSQLAVRVVSACAYSFSEGIHQTRFDLTCPLFPLT